MNGWAWIGLALALALLAGGWWGWTRLRAILAARDLALAVCEQALVETRTHLAALQHTYDLTCARLEAAARAQAVLQAEHERVLVAWPAEVARTRADWSRDAQALYDQIARLHTHLGQSVNQVTALSEATALSKAAVLARADWVHAFTRNFNPAVRLALDPVPAKGWQCVLLEAGQPVSIRTLRDGNAPTRIQRAHGSVSDWYRLVRVDGLSLIYELEFEPAAA